MKCPYCAEMIQEEAVLCRYCKKSLEAEPDNRNKENGTREMDKQKRIIFLRGSFWLVVVFMLVIIWTSPGPVNQGDIVTFVFGTFLLTWLIERFSKKEK
mgnify:CR=1 FL=1